MDLDVRLPPETIPDRPLFPGGVLGYVCVPCRYVGGRDDCPRCGRDTDLRTIYNAPVLPA